jgi:hypothetical protein
MAAVARGSFGTLGCLQVRATLLAHPSGRKVENLVCCSRALPPRCDGERLGYPVLVSPTVLRVKGFRFYFFSREEPSATRAYAACRGEAKFWIDPAVELHANYGLKAKRLAEAQKLLEEHVDEIRSAWEKHFPG